MEAYTKIIAIEWDKLMHKIKKPAVAGAFYPDEPDILNNMVEHLFDAITWAGSSPKAIIAPHAGYIYSGIAAACAYQCLEMMPYIKNIILVGPSHYIAFNGVAYSDYDTFITPLGELFVNTNLIQQIAKLPATQHFNDAFSREHCLEVQFPFLQKKLNEFTIVPLLVSGANKQTVASVLEALWGDKETLVIISSDLSHYHDYLTAQQLDSETSQAIVNLDADNIKEDSACGRIAIRGLLHLAKQKKMQAKKILQINSGDTAGDKQRVVGYGAYHFFENEVPA